MELAAGTDLFRRIDAASTGGASAGAEAVDVHEFVEDDELDGEFDGVGERLGSGFVDPLATVDLADEGDVEDDAEHIEVDEETLGDAEGFGSGVVG